MDPQQAQEHAMRIIATFFPLIGIFILVVIAIYIIPLWRICTKAGLAGPLSLLVLIPGIGKLIVIYIIAFTDWKVVPAPTDYPGIQPYPPPPSSYQPPPPTNFHPPPPPQP